MFNAINLYGIYVWYVLLHTTGYCKNNNMPDFKAQQEIQVYKDYG